MNQELENLISLQTIDSQIFDIESLAGDLPQKVAKKEEIAKVANSVDEDTNILDASKLPDQKEIIAKGKMASASQKEFEKEALKHKKEASNLQSVADRAKENFESL